MDNLENRHRVALLKLVRREIKTGRCGVQLLITLFDLERWLRTNKLKLKD